MHSSLPMESSTKAMYRSIVSRDESTFHSRMISLVFCLQDEGSEVTTSHPGKLAFSLFDNASLLESNGGGGIIIRGGKRSFSRDVPGIAFGRGYVRSVQVRVAKAEPSSLE
mmetsp:Transcript_12495/g.25583  ORF Transcript_12495/g.25583 Transcript_12495/m.25583 type:complete len:111 (+) Transcript_12495:194-526(+)